MNDKQFWENIQPLVVEDDSIFTRDAKNAEILNTFFSDPLKDLKIPDFEEVNPFDEKTWVF